MRIALLYREQISGLGSLGQSEIVPKAMTPIDVRFNATVKRLEAIYKTQISGLGGALVNELDQLVSTIGGWSMTEHDDDGRHTDITADSITVTEITITGGEAVVDDTGFSVNVSIEPLPTPPAVTNGFHFVPVNIPGDQMGVTGYELTAGTIRGMQLYNLSTDTAVDTVLDISIGMAGGTIAQIVLERTMAGTTSIDAAATAINLSASTLTLTAATMIFLETTATFSGTVDVAGDFSVATNKFVVDDLTGDTDIAGTLDVVGNFAVNITRLTVNATTGAVGVLGNFAINTNKFTVAAATGNTLVAGTFDVTGNVAVATNKFTIAAASGNTLVAGTLGVGVTGMGSSTLKAGSTGEAQLTIAADTDSTESDTDALLRFTVDGDVGTLKGAIGYDQGLDRLVLGYSFSNLVQISSAGNVSIPQSLQVNAAALPGAGTGFIVFPDGTVPSSLASNTAALYGDDFGGTVALRGINEVGDINQITQGFIPTQRDLAPGSFTVPTGRYIVTTSLTLSGSQSATLNGTAKWVIV